MLLAVFSAAWILFLAFNPKSLNISLPAYIPIFGLLLFLVLYSVSGKVVREIKVDTENSVLKISYFTLVSQKNILELPLNEIEYSYKWQPSKYPPKKYRLKIYQKNAIVFHIDSNDDGFAENQFSELIKEFDSLKVKHRINRAATNKPLAKCWRTMVKSAVIC